jgi:hypothetical protein
MATKTKRQAKHSHKRLILYSAAGLAVVLILAVQAALFMNLYQRSERLAPDKIQTLIVEAMRSLYRDAVIEPVSGKVYVPETRLAFQNGDGTLRIVYSAVKDPDTVTVTDKKLLNRNVAKIYSAQSLAETFDRVPELQACARQVHILFSPASNVTGFSENDVKPEFTRKLADGRTVYAYTEKNSPCTADNTELLALLQTVQSY